MIYLYLLLGYLLSILAFVVYRFFIKNKITPKQRKTYIYSTVILSLVLPLLFLQSGNLFPFASEQTASIVRPDDFVNEPVLDKALSSCYDKVTSQEGLCHCEQLQQSNLLYYQPNVFYNFTIRNKAIIQYITVSIAALVLLGLLFKIGYLLFLITTGSVQKRTIDNKNYRILRREGDFMAASFRLWYSYVLWHPSLDLMSEEEQKAILMHEISHLKNGDTFEQIGLAFLQIVWIINPVFYFIKKELELINEFIADQFALDKTGNPKLYATLLVKLKEKQQIGLAQHVSGNILKTRLLAIINRQKFIYMRYMPAIIIVVASLMLAISASTVPLMSEQYALYEEYCMMHDEHTKTGKTVFCRSCLYEDLLRERQVEGSNWTKLVEHNHE